jgi:hypothetical protein
MLTMSWQRLNTQQFYVNVILIKLIDLKVSCKSLTAFRAIAKGYQIPFRAVKHAESAKLRQC